jgi:hypothetical protein
MTNHVRCAKKLIGNGTKLVRYSVKTLIRTGLTSARLQISHELERMGASLDERVQGSCVFETDVISFPIRSSSGPRGGGIRSEPVSSAPY